MSVRAAAALAAGMGIGRFAYTPILPLMTAQAGLSAASAASLATANYLGYFVGALATVVRAPSLLANRVALVLLVATLAGMPLTHSMAVWFALRLVAGVASAVVFVAAVNARPGWGMSGVGLGIALAGLVVLGLGQWQAAWWVAAGLAAVLGVAAWGLRPEPPKASGVAEAPKASDPPETSSSMVLRRLVNGVRGSWQAARRAAAGLAAMLGLAVWGRRPEASTVPGAAEPPEMSSSMVLRRLRGSWQAAWRMATGLAAALGVATWRLRPEAPKASDLAEAPKVSDLPETIGVGTRRPLGAGKSASIRGPRRAFGFLFAAYSLEGVGYIIAATFLVAAISGPHGTSAWVLVGLSAALSPVLIKPRRHALPAALAVQAAGIALAALAPGSALLATLLFGGTFIGIAATALKQGADLGIPNAAAILTAGYSAGQIVGPLLAAPLLATGYDQALLLAAAIVAAAAVTALAPPSRRLAVSRRPRRTAPGAPAG
ncbi:YbfB/YjiJ family MFS transporter [Lentzea sp. CA-135723]|uniref:YbfB/YjiJ family MFS transporter n=1 Tax=Lentzea sp. CA-135723 TaxID=3239950 RepID=UPI003D9237C5